MGNSGTVVSLTFNYGRFRSESEGIYGVLTLRSFCWSWVKKGPRGQCAYHPYY